MKKKIYKKQAVITLISNQQNALQLGFIPLLLVLLYQSSGTSAFFQIPNDLHNLLVVHIYEDILKRGKPGWGFKFKCVNVNSVLNIALSLQLSQFVSNTAHVVFEGSILRFKQLSFHSPFLLRYILSLTCQNCNDCFLKLFSYN